MGGGGLSEGGGEGRGCFDEEKRGGHRGSWVKR